MKFTKYKLKELCTKITDGSHYSPKEQSDGYPMFSVKDMGEYGFIYDNVKHISKSDLDYLKRNDCVPQKDDVLIAKDGSYLTRVFVCPETKDEAILSSIAIFRCKKDIIDPYFLCLLFQTPYIHDYAAKSCVSGSALPRIILKAFAELELDIPSLEIQKSIVSIIRPIDKKIALNRRENALLEKVAKEMYDYWFVQFDFPDEEGKPYRSSGGKMVWNEELRREVPEGWSVIRFDKFVDIFTGKKDVSKVAPGPYKFFSCAPDPIYSNDYIGDGEVILVSGNGSYTGRVTYYNGKYDLYQRTYGCKLKNGHSNIMPFLYFTMKNIFEPLFTGGKHGSAIPYIVLEDLAGFNIVFCQEYVDNYVKLIEAMFCNRFKNIQENEKLTSLRDFLLQMLMNGQVGIRE